MKSTTSRQRQVVHLTADINVCGTTNTWKRALKTIVFATLQYGSESWIPYQHHLRLLKWFHLRFLGNILNIHWNEFVTNIDVLEKVKIINIKGQLRRAGHVSRMRNNHQPRIIICREFLAGRHDREQHKNDSRSAWKNYFGDCHNRSLPMVHSSREPWRLASHHQPSCLLLYSAQKWRAVSQYIWSIKIISKLE